MNKIIFLSGPLRGDGKKETKEKNIEVARKYARLFIDNEIPYYSPHLNIDQEIVSLDREFKEPSFSWYLNAEFLNRCDALAVLPGWETSNGTKIEIENATKKSLPIFYLSEQDAIKDILDWLK